VSALTDQVQSLLNQASEILPAGAGRDRIEEAQLRLGQPLRVAIAGKVKAGKSTLLNALVGERLAPTDAGECTKLVTWYRDGATYRVLLHPKSGAPEQLPFRRDDNALEVDLRGNPAEDVERLEIEWPSATLADMTLIDTPGVDSINHEISARTEAFLSHEDGPAAADAVVYLMRHFHQTDVRFLESFHDQVASQPSAINSIGILSRADEVGVGRLDAMVSAKRIAARYTADPKVRRLCQVVLPMAGLLAETAATLRQDEFRSLHNLATSQKSDLENLLLSVDRFANAETPILITPIEREDLLARFGMFGIRLATTLIQIKPSITSSGLVTALVDRSGLNGLRETLHSHFGARSDVLRARSSLLMLEEVLAGARDIDTRHVGTELERIMSTVHEFAEVQLLSMLRSGRVTLPGSDPERAEQLLGATGTFAHERLGVERETTATEMLTLALEQHAYWQAMSENPMIDRAGTVAARVLTRSCEGLLAGLHAAR
jgi:GTPase SAR1 family protein